MKIKKEQYEKGGLEKIIIATSTPFETAATGYTNYGQSFADTRTTTGKLTFVGTRKDYDKFITFLKEADMYDMLDEIYIYDRFHVSGEDMIEKVLPTGKHDFSQVIKLKEKFKKCWWNGEVEGCRLFSEFAFDPQNELF